MVKIIKKMNEYKKIIKKIQNTKYKPTKYKIKNKFYKI